MAAIVFRRCLFKKTKLNPFQLLCLNQKKEFHYWYVPVMAAMKKRRKIAGPPPETPRSLRINWNRASEIYAFGKRLNEEFKEETLEMAFTHQSYIEKEEERRKSLEVTTEDLSRTLKDNSQLVIEGTAVMTTYILAYLRYVLPLLPEEGICAIHDYLISEDILAYISSNIGTSELILCAEEPPNQSTLAITLKAIIGAIQRDQNLKKAEIFIQDFILTQLIGKDISDLWDIPNCMAVLTSILEREGRDLPEPRLLWKAATNTIQAVYHVGIYCSKTFLGAGPGETVSTAVDIAARDALNRMFHVTTDQMCLQFGEQGYNLPLNKNEINIELSQWTSNKVIEKSKIRQL